RRGDAAGLPPPARRAAERVSRTLPLRRAGVALHAVTQVSRSGAHHAARGAPLPGLCIEEPLQALRGRTRARSLLVGGVLRRVAAAGRTRATGASRPSADLARRDWLATARTARHRRTASPVLAARGLCPESRWPLRQSVGMNRVAAWPAVPRRAVPRRRCPRATPASCSLGPRSPSTGGDDGASASSPASRDGVDHLLRHLAASHACL